MSTATLPAPATAVNATPAVFTMTAADRCDACGARAYVEVKIGRTDETTGDPKVSELLFCVHHFDKHEQRLSPSTLSVKDERGRLYDEEKARTKE